VAAFPELMLSFGQRHGGYELLAASEVFAVALMLVCHRLYFPKSVSLLQRDVLYSRGSGTGCLRLDPSNNERRVSTVCCISASEDSYPEVSGRRVLRFADLSDSVGTLK
jgi:hypothetical protein